MFTTLIVLQVLIAAGLIAIVLVQRGPGATMGAAFGSGASGTVFGSRGAGNFLTRTTSWLAVAFFGISLALAVLATSYGRPGDTESALSGSVMDQPAQPAEPDIGAGIESAIDELDENPDSSARQSPTDVIDAAERSGEVDSPQDDDGAFPEPPPNG